MPPFRWRTQGRASESGAGSPPENVERPSEWRPDLGVFWPAFPPQGYLGQLTDEHQRSLADQRRHLTLDHCTFYHSVRLPDGTEVTGPWDLRGHEHEYLGGIDLDGRRVLEIGPASGSVTFWMEEQGADVVAFDAGYDVSVDIQPPLGFDDRQLKYQHIQVAGSYQNAWWYLHRELGSSARMVYGDIYDLPRDIGEFDVSVVTAVLLHCRNPFTVLEQAARRTSRTIVVTEPVPDDLLPFDADVMRPFPLGEDGRWVIWWSIYAGAVVSMLSILGFADVTITRHTQRHQYGHDRTQSHEDVPMYTVVGHRSH